MTTINLLQLSQLEDYLLILMIKFMIKLSKFWIFLSSESKILSKYQSI